MKARKITAAEFDLLPDKEQLEWVASRLKGKVLFREMKAEALKEIKMIKKNSFPKQKNS